MLPINQPLLPAGMTDNDIEIFTHDKKSTEPDYMPTYYDVAPEHNERMNVKGFRNLMYVIILLTISILLTCLL